MDNQVKGLITNIQRTSVNDGPGIRTTVFLKGCNMRCAWCHNPESNRFEPEVVMNPELCLQCGYCEQGCYSGARKLCGQYLTVEQVLEDVLMDQPYYGEDGGLTISGGEPFMQPEFVQALLRTAKEQGIHCGIETNATALFDVMKEALPFVDIWMVDLKAFNDDIHKENTGISNEQIKENIIHLDQHGARIVLRTPIVSGINDTVEELEEIIAFGAQLQHLEYYEALPYHPLGLSKHVEEADFIREFPMLDKETIKQKLLAIMPKYDIAVRLANVKIS